MSEQLSYALVQYVGDPVRQEAINIGLAAVGEGGRVAVTFDGKAPFRLQRSWPGFNHQLVWALIGDLRHVLGEQHQMMLAEGELSVSATATSLSSLAASLPNQFRLTEPKHYVSENFDSGVRALFRRLVVAP